MSMIIFSYEASAGLPCRKMEQSVYSHIVSFQIDYISFCCVKQYITIELKSRFCGTIKETLGYSVIVKPGSQLKR